MAGLTRDFVQFYGEKLTRTYLFLSVDVIQYVVVNVFKGTVN